MPPTQPTPLNWPAIGIFVVAVINIVGWFVVNSLNKRREVQRDKEAAKRTSDGVAASRKLELLSLLASWKSEIEQSTAFHEVGRKYTERAVQLRGLEAKMRGDYSGKPEFFALVDAIGSLNANTVGNEGPHKTHLLTSIEALSKYVIAA